MAHRNQFDQTPEEPTFFEKLAEVEETLTEANSTVPESLLGQTDKILAEGPELPSIDELIRVEKDPEVLAQLVILRDGLSDDYGPASPEEHEEVVKRFDESLKVDGVHEHDVRAHRRAQHDNLKEQ